MFKVALKHHQAGQLAEAERLYRQILAIDANHVKSLHFLGVIAHQVGRHEVAVALIGQAIAHNKRVPMFHYNIGEALRRLERLDEAARHYRKAIKLKPDYAEAYHSLGLILKVHGHFDEAAKHYLRAVQYDPANAEAWNNLGNLRVLQGNASDAITHFQRALALRPNHPQILTNLANALVQGGKLDEALKHYQRVILTQPDYPEAHMNLASALKLAGRLDEAAAHFRQAITLKPSLAEAHYSLGNVLQEQGREEEAITHCQRALALRPNSAELYRNVGVLFQFFGRIDQARRHFESAINLEPRNPRYYLALSKTKRFEPDDSYLAAMEKMAKDLPSLAPQKRIELHFALAKAHADLGLHERSFHHLIEGNTLKRQQITYNEQAKLKWFEQIRTVFTRELIACKQGFGEPSHVPIFVIGMPRSGSTLVEQILASHPQVHGAGEVSVLDDVLRELCGPQGNHVAYPELVPALDAATVGNIGARYLAKIRELAPDASHITDKNLSNYYFAGLIHLALPNARIIHTVRDPIDTCVSCFSKLFEAEQNYTYNLAELGRYYRCYGQLMAHWHSVLPLGRILDVRYEDLIADLEGQARRIIGHCRLDWNARCLSFHLTDRPVRTESAIQVRQPIYTNAVGRWRVYEEFLTPLLAALGMGEPAA
jgi:tetratricopeptide (TPR) repeat protein